MAKTIGTREGYSYSGGYGETVIYEKKQSLTHTWEEFDGQVIGSKQLRRYIAVPKDILTIAVIVTLVVLAITVPANYIRNYSHRQAIKSCAAKEAASQGAMDTEVLTGGFWSWDCYVHLETGEVIPYGRVKAEINKIDQ